MGYILSQNEAGIVRSGELRSGQKESPRGVLSKKYSYKFCKTRRKTPVPVSFLIKRLPHRCFPVNFTKYVRIPFFT